jgi:SAM-dependent methyltransferase
MDSHVFERIAGYYDELVTTYGHSPRACDYGRPESQKQKFEVLSHVADLGGKSVLDVGCGFGDFSNFLAERFPSLTYRGVDISPQMVENARALNPAADIVQCNILHSAVEPADVVTANGIFYLLGSGAEEVMQQLVARMFELCKEAVAFNSLSGWAPEPEAGEFYADPARTLAFCRTLTPWVTLRHDYHPHDFTVYMYRRQQS